MISCLNSTCSGPRSSLSILKQLTSLFSHQLSGSPANQEQPLIGFVELPKVLPRLLEVSRSKGQFRFIFLEDLIIHNLACFGLSVDSVHLIRVTRDRLHPARE